MLKKLLRICSGMGSFLLGCICLGFFIAATHDLIVGDPETGRDVLAVLFVFFGMLSLGSFTATFLSFKPFIFGEKNSSAEHEHKILNFAKASGGRITVGEAALNCHLSIDTVREALDSMAARGINQMELMDDGTIVYVFTEFTQQTQLVEPPKPVYPPRQME